MWTLGILLLLLASAEPSFSLSPADCEAAEATAGEILHLINEERREGYQFQLLRVVDAHTDVHEEKSAVIHYLALDVIESDCSVLSSTHWEDCQPKEGRRPFEIVIGRCKVVAVTHPNTSCEHELTKVIEFNCTTSSVSSALFDPRQGPVLIDYFEEPEQYRKQAERALKQYEKDVGTSSFQVVKVERAARVRGGERTNLFLDFSIRNHSAEEHQSPSTRHFSRSCPVFGFCQATFVYDVENSDLSNPNDLTVDCEIFKVEDSRNFSSGRHHHRFHGHFGRHGPHFPGGPHPAQKPLGHGCPEHSHHHSHRHRRPPHTHQSGTKEEHLSSPDDSPGLHPPSVETEDSDHGRHGPHKSCSHGHGPCKHDHHGHGHHGHGQHGHSHHGHGHRGHGHHGHGSHEHGHHGHGPPRDGPYGHGPCRYGPPLEHSEGKDSHKPFHRRDHGVVYRLPPLKKGEVLPLPEIDIPSKDHDSHPGSHHPPRPKLQPFPQTSSESCPGSLKKGYPQVLPFLESKDIK